MKKCWILVLALLLAGCSRQGALETVSDEYVQLVSAEKWQLVLDIPLDAGVQVMESDDLAKLYFCDNYLVTVQTVSSGDLDKTLRSATGYGEKELNLMKTQQDGLERYECVFVSAGEAETQIGRTCILDDGSYHYVLSVMADAEVTQQYKEIWNGMFESFTLI